MTRCFLPQGRHDLSIDIPDACLGDVIVPPRPNLPADPQQCIRAALAHPIAAPRLEERVRPSDRIAIIVDDITRETPVSLILPLILETLAKRGVPRRQIAIVIALGTHRPMTPDEIERKVGTAVAGSYRIVNEPAGNHAEMVYLGQSPQGIPAWVNRTVAQSDVRIGIGMIMPHLDAGYGGGAKIVLPGVCSEATVDAFHCRMAAIETNPLGMENAALRLELERFVNERVRLHFIVNVILDSRGGLYRCVAGDAVDAHRAGIRFAREVYGVPVERRYPLVIANAHPHQIDLWQCTKALAAGEMLTRSGGTLILVAGCPEGTGPHPRFADYIGMALEALLQRVHGEASGDRCAAAEAVAVCRLKRRIRIGMVSAGLPAETIRRMGFDRYATVEAAIERKRRQIGRQGIAVLTHAGVTLPLPPERET